MKIHLGGLIEGRRHDQTLNVFSGQDETLQACLLYAGTQYIAYGDSGYSSRSFMFVPFSGSYLTEEQNAFNKAIDKGKVTL